jgi:L-2-hydroxyglutarate oxidase
MKASITTDICIIGAGMVGLSIAHQLLANFNNLSILIIDKEPKVGSHGSGRNSGVLHAGVYYQPDSLKAKVCVAGAKRLREWCEDEQLPVLSCGKVITPQKVDLDNQLEILLARGLKNGAAVEIIDQQQFNELVPHGRTTTGRALWSPDTCVVKPILVVERLHQRLKERGVKFLMANSELEFSPNNQQIKLDSSTVTYGHLFNCAGLQADRIAHSFDIGKHYTMLPFKGSYWQLKANAPFKFNTNLYPVPDLDVPFLGVHATPSIDGVTYLGPTATPALGRENYKGLDGVEPLMALEFLRHMVTQVIIDKKMRNYVSNQAFDWTPKNFLNAVKAIIPKIEMIHIERSSKVGIRSQLYDKNKKELVQDFVMLNANSSTHVVNAISPGFTASFALADHILENSKFNQ